jgi:hypothetical protein
MSELQNILLLKNYWNNNNSTILYCNVSLLYPASNLHIKIPKIKIEIIKYSVLVNTAKPVTTTTGQ